MPDAEVGAHLDGPSQERARPGAGHQIEDLGDVVGSQVHRVGVRLGPQRGVHELDARALAEHLPAVGNPLDRLDPYGVSRPDERVQVGPGRRVGRVGERREGVGLRPVAGRAAVPVGEVGVRAGEGGPDGVVQDGGVRQGRGGAWADVGRVCHGIDALSRLDVDGSTTCQELSSGSPGGLTSDFATDSLERP